jgi:hypothetical protein
MAKRSTTALLLLNLQQLQLGVYVPLGDCIPAAAATAPQALLLLLRRLRLLLRLLLRLAACCCRGGAAGQGPTSHPQAQPVTGKKQKPNHVSTEGAHLKKTCTHS